VFARVALDLPVPTEFTYAVPDRLRGEVALGQRVRVPFRTSSRVGYLVALEGATDLPRVKEISDILDREPILPPDLLELARWISSYYAASLGETIQAMLPGGVRRRRPQVAVVVRTGGGEVAARAKKAAAVLAALAEFDRPPRIADLLARAGATRAALKTLETAGLVKIEKQDAVDPFDRGWEGVPGEGSPSPLVLEADQARAFGAIVEDIEGGRFATHLLLGVTGSGKTEVYLRAIREAVARGRQAIVLVPEIALTPQTVRRFLERFRHVAVLHSAQSDTERRRSWQAIRRGEVDVVIGPRSATFAPVPRLGLLVVDEEHETSFKQGEPPPRYHARDVGIVRARSAACPVVLGSATPALESWHNAQRGRYRLHRMPLRAGGFPLPPVELVDMTAEGDFVFSRRLRIAVLDAVRDGGQVILFLNRRGFATVVYCTRCRERLTCPNCSTMLVFHKGRKATVCHLCGHESRPPERCRACHAPALKHVGSGTERVAEEAAAAWPGVPIVRIDSDTARGDELERCLERFRTREAKILVGTQMVAKGHHFPEVTLVGIINADTALHLADFRANERTFGLISQVSGRAGRGDLGGRVIVQTCVPDHYAITCAQHHDYEGFAKRELEEREALGLPPLTRCALLEFAGADESAVRQAAQRVAEAIAPLARKEQVGVRGPAKAPIERARNKWRFMILLLSARPPALATIGRAARAAHRGTKISLSLDVDPVAVL